MENESSILSFRNLSKSFARTNALENINLEIKKGEVFGLLGPNGAGKTTLIRCLIKLINPTQGDIFYKDRLLLDKDVHEHFGFLPENFQPPANLSAQEFLEILCWGLNLKTGYIDSCLKDVGLINQKDKLIKAYSRGMIQRLGLAIALLKQPQVIILDEPTLGLDPIGQNQILSLLIDLHSQGKTIFFSSHIFSQIEKVCNRIGIIHQGKLGFVGSIKDFLDKHHSPTLEEGFLKEVEADDQKNTSR